MSVRWTQQKTREQYRAWYAVKSAIRRGILIRPETCQRCGCRPGLTKRGRSKIEAHHYKGYAPEHHLTVEFLCSKCHKLADAEMLPPPQCEGPGSALIQRLRDLKDQREQTQAS